MAGYIPISLLKFIYPVPEPNFTRDRPLQVLALGLGRTGTESLALALDNLGFGDVYHGWKTAEQPGCYVQWTRLGSAKYSTHHKNPSLLNRAEFDRVIGHCGAVTDLPTAAFAPEMLRAYPEAKVILNRRRDVDAWYESQKMTIATLFADWKTITPCLFEAQLFWTWQCVRFVVFKMAGDDFERNGREMYLEHYARLEAECRRQGREWLDWTVQDGWEPLCKFLDKPVPDHPFPSGNTVGDFDARRARVHKQQFQRALRNASIVGVLLMVAIATVWYRVSSG
ncbi:hypothetical protein B0A55_05384 [Friedmanniomyces simplex]|uniref:NAD dependent epimerase/dehydratase n=1 Tax=Friedmanniomyces simplex TaxID=329884 RepID=A0A4U0X8P6_9PEZI|nr:hypothetical protein B0A55_05384 [Friedmanniomyces simplex]